MSASRGDFASPERSALVTGASRGIGAAIAEMLARRGYALTISARDSAALEAMATHLRSVGARKVELFEGDLAEGSTPGRLVDFHRAAFGQLSCLVVNAGIGTAGPLMDIQDARLDKMIAVNLRAPVQIIRDALPLLREGARADPARGARVAVLASVTGVHAESGLAVYGATKAALVSLVNTLNAEESGSGVTATAIAPGYVETDMSAWVTDRIPAETMIPVSDIALILGALLDLSRRSVVSQVLVTRAGTSGHVA